MKPILTKPFIFCGLLLAFISNASRGTCSAGTRPNDDFEFFEKRIRPILVEYCYECHNSTDSKEGGLAVDHREALLEGGFSGVIVVPGNPAESQLLPILRHEIEGLEMPAGGPKLDERMVKDFEKWIADGAPDPRDSPPSEAEIKAATSWEAMRERRKQWWSFQPIQSIDPPEIASGDSAFLLTSSNPIDRFIGSSLIKSGLEAARPANAETIVRRLYFTLIGLPPSHDEAVSWSQRIRDANEDARIDVIEELVDRLLASPQFGEHWARHWMDWIRYAESHGSEGDPLNANAWLYRDYLIRALNQDVPYDQLVREHVAGDLISSPRMNRDLGINESIIGTAHWRMVFHGFAPTDALDEKVRFIDDEINAFSKAFLGLTVSCARCHDHKFDAISQADYYALFGVLGSCRPGRSAIDTLDRQQLHREELSNIKDALRNRLAESWLQSARQFMGQVRDEDQLIGAAEAPDLWLNVLHEIHKAIESGMTFQEAWEQQNARLRDIASQWNTFEESAASIRWNLAEPIDHAAWYRTGIGLADEPSRAGAWSVATQGDSVVTGIYPSGVFSHLLSDKHAARLSSPDVNLHEEYEVWIEAIGAPSASVRYAVQDYPRSGTVYPVQKLANSWRWQRFDLSYWKDDRIHLELSTAQDAPLLVESQDRSWFGVRHAVLVKKGTSSPPPLLQHLLPLYQQAQQQPPRSWDDLINLMEQVLVDAIQAWNDETASDSQALLIDALLRQKVLPNTTRELSHVGQLLERYRSLESEIPAPTRVPTLTETEPRDQPLFIRGNHKKPANPVPRRFLEAIDATPYSDRNSGRVQLAEDLLRDDNPLTRRVIVNRVWHHVFGQGIVATPDNFGRLGDRPSHPELLDWLAVRFVDERWSLKKLIRQMVTSQAWQLDSQASDLAKQIDPDNRLLSHANVSRLEAEAIRDSILSVSGQLQQKLGGEPVDGNVPRRSVYMRVIRNSLDPFLRAFDFPEPFTTVGRRDVTNVPAQSLTLMNDPQVAAAAQTWAQQTLANNSLEENSQRISQMFWDAFARPPTHDEMESIQQFIEQTRTALEARIARVQQLRERLEACSQSVDAIKDPICQAILDERGQEAALPIHQSLEPIAAWDFTTSTEDLVGEADASLHGDIQQTPDGLIATGGYAISQPIAKELSAKTLEAWVQLDSLQQQGGGVLSVQTPNGNEFDAMVIGEQQQGHWLAGSNFFARTQPFNGPAEEVADQEPVHLAFVYAGDGTITAFRNGKPYGTAYASNGPRVFAANEYVVGFGIRHLPAGGNKLLSGRIVQARLYDRALTAEEVAHSATGSNRFVAEKEIVARLTPADRDRLVSLENERKALSSELQEYESTPQRVDALAVWTELARALFTVKEFIYVR